MALYDEGLQRAGNWVSNYIKNSMLPNLNPNPMMGVRPPTTPDMSSFTGTSSMNLPAPPPPAPTGQPKIPQGKSASSSQGTSSATPAIPPPPPLPNPQQQIQMGQLAAVPEYIARFLVDVGRLALQLPDASQQPPLPEGPSATPSHGYRIAEGGNPEVVNAEGAYFPFESGQVTPLQNMAEGGDVEPSGMVAYEATGRKMRGLPAMANPPSGMTEYEESAARMRQPVLTTPVMGNRMLPYNERLSRYGSGGLSAYGSSPDQADINRFKALGWMNPYGNMRRYGQRKFEDIPLLPAAEGIDVTPMWDWATPEEKEELRTPMLTETEPLTPGGIYRTWQKSRGFPSPNAPVKMKLTPSGVYEAPRPKPISTLVNRPTPLPPTPVVQTGPMGEAIQPRVPGEMIPYAPEKLDTGIRYSVGGYGPPVRGDFLPESPEAMEIAAMNRWATPGYGEARLAGAKEKYGPGVFGITPGYERGYYDAHPEERQAELAMDLMRRLGPKESFSNVYKALSDYGMAGPETEKNLAYAEHMRNLTPAQIQMERERSASALQINRERIAGDLQIAGISAEKNDLLTKGINSIFAKAAGSMFPVDVTGEINGLLRLGVSLGWIDQDKYNRLPLEYRTTVTRKQAIEYLTSKKAPITEANIQAVLQRGIQ